VASVHSFPPLLVCISRR